MSSIGEYLEAASRRHRSRKYRALAILGGLGLIVFIVLSAVDIFSFDRDFYEDVYGHLDTAEQIGVSEDDLDNATDVLLDYIRNKRDDLEISVTLTDSGEEVAMYNNREILHMEDVKILYSGAMLVRWVSLITAAAAAIILAARYKRDSIAMLRTGYFIALLIFGLIIVGVGLFAWLDFNRFWTTFHEIFFRNDLWILNPATDRMILMVPAYFFNTLVLRIITASLAAMAAVGILLGIFAAALAKRQK